MSSSGDSRSQVPNRCEEAERFKNEGNLFLQQGKFQEAVEMYTKSITSDSRNAVYYANRAAAYNQLGDYEKSIKDCETAISIDPNYSKAYNRLGSAQLALGKFQEAMKTLEEAVKLDPNNETTQNLLKTAKEKTLGSGSSRSSGLGGSGLNLESLQPLLEKFGKGGNKEGESGLSSLLNQPGLMEMAQQMIQNNPEMVQQLAGMFGMGNKPRAP